MKALRSLSHRSKIRQALRALGLVLAVTAMPRAARAETIAAGIVTDVTTGAPIAGAKVTIRAESVLGEARTDGSGIYRLPFGVASSAIARTLTLTVEQDDYAAASASVVVTAGRTDRTAYPVQLLPKSLGPCRRGRDHVVVVGHFQPPVSGPAMQDDLASQVAAVLRYGLLPLIQQQHLSQGSQPLIVACDEAKPRAPEDAPGYAKALGADAFLWGTVRPSGGRFKVVMTVGNGHDSTAPPVQTSSKDVDLDDPTAAHLDPTAYEAVLTALVAGYEARSPAECVEVLGAAERILGPLPPALEAVRLRCQQKLPNRGLLREGTP